MFGISQSENTCSGESTDHDVPSLPEGTAHICRIKLAAKLTLLSEQPLLVQGWHRRLPRWLLTVVRLVRCAHLWHDNQQSSWLAPALTAAAGA